MKFSPFLIPLLFLLSCKKELVVNLVTVDQLKVEPVGDLAANIRFQVHISGHPIVVEKGIILTVNPIPDLLNARFKNESSDDVVLKTMSVSKLQSETTYYVQAYVFTDRDTVFSEVVSFKTGSYFKTGSGVQDASGNSYPTVVIGTQEWLAQNLRTTKFSNGDDIEKMDSSGEWVAATGPGWYNYAFEAQGDPLRGSFYNGYTVIDERNVCPTGWHVSTEQDWATLIYFLGNDKYVGGKLKATGTVIEGTGPWEYPNAFGTNAAGFNAVPTGEQNYTSFYGKDEYAFFWKLNDQNTQSFLQSFALYYHRGIFDIYGNDERNGAVVRCVKD